MTSTAATSVSSITRATCSKKQATSRPTTSPATYSTSTSPAHNRTYALPPRGSLTVLTVDPFVYMWAYRVPSQRADEFRDLYGPEGPWAAATGWAV